MCSPSPEGHVRLYLSSGRCYRGDAQAPYALLGENRLNLTITLQYPMRSRNFAGRFPVNGVSIRSNHVAKVSGDSYESYLINRGPVTTLLGYHDSLREGFRTS